jgi:glucose/arabinose dehydrogenase
VSLWKPQRHRVAARLLLIAVAVVFIGGGTAAAACKLWLNCHLRSAPSLANEITKFEGKPASLAGLAADLKATTVARGFAYPTDFAFLPDGRVLVAEKSGRIDVVSGRGHVEKQPFLDLRSRTDTTFYRGIVGLAVDPDFKRFPYVYVAYTPRLAVTNSTKSTVVRISRFRVVGGVADPASEKVIVGPDDRLPCEDQPLAADCLPSALDVDGADFAFAPDGTLYVATGFGGGYDGVEPLGLLAQNVGTLGGKILHIDRDGHGLRGNPYWNGNPDANRSKVWAVGLRNPFRMSLLPGSPVTLVVGDVGLNNWESLARVTRGGNDGWPCFEAASRTPTYRDASFCKSFYRAHPTAPMPSWIALPHPGAAAIIAGSSLAGATALPSRLRSDFVFGDWVSGQITLLPLDALSSPRQTVLARGAGGPVRFRIGPDGALYYLAANIGELRRITARKEGVGG